MVAESISVGVIEDHPLFRGALTDLIEAEPDIEVDAVAESVAQFVARRRNGPGVVLLDLRLPGVSGAAAVMEVAALGYQVLVISASDGQSEVMGAMAAGARGYLTKDSGGAEVLRAIREIAAGGSYVSPMLASYVLHEWQDRNAGPTVELSTRERQVLSLVAAGERDQDIAELLAISIRTVRSYLDRIRDKTGQRRRPELTRYAIEKGVAYVRQLSA
jgi:DNA-binding NarL/FixJ family response regulator